MRPVSTTSSVERCAKISRSGKWMVTGTTASSGDHSIITGRSDLAGRFVHQRGQKFGMTRFGKSPIVEHVLGHRVGDDRGRGTRQDVGDRAANGGDGGRCARPVRVAGLGAHGDVEGDDRQRRRKRRGGGARRYGRDRNVEAEPSGAAAEKIRVGNKVERWECRVRRVDARRQAQGRARSRRARRASMPMAARSCFLSPYLSSGILYSIIAWRRKLSR